MNVMHGVTCQKIITYMKCRNVEGYLHAKFHIHSCSGGYRHQIFSLAQAKEKYRSEATVLLNIL